MTSFEQKRDGNSDVVGNHIQGVSTPNFSAVFDNEFAYVARSLRRLGVAERDSEDTAQEVFLVVHGLLEDFDPERPIRPWLFGICYRIALRYRDLARHKREVLGSSEPEKVDDAPDPERKLQQEEARALVARALDHLDVRVRAVFVMCEIDGFAVPEIARSLEIPLNTAYSRLRLGR